MIQYGIEKDPYGIEIPTLVGRWRVIEWGRFESFLRELDTLESWDTNSLEDIKEELREVSDTLRRIQSELER